MTDKHIKSNTTNETNEDAIDLQDLSFDFEDYFRRFAEGTMPDKERNEYTARVIGLFVRETFKSKGNDDSIKSWATDYIANALFEVLGGAPFSDVLPTPFEPQQSLYTEKENRAFNTYCFIENGKRSGKKISDLLMQHAINTNLSYESVRSDYYKIKNALDIGKTIQEAFSKKST